MGGRRWASFAAALALVGASLSGAQTASGKASEFRLVGYLPDYRLANYDLERARGLTDLILFSAEPTAEGGLDLKRLSMKRWPELRAFKTAARMRLILCVGGWERSQRFPQAAGAPANRERFAEAAVQFCLRERFDGLDLDWEHPHNAAEQQSYADLLAELRKRFAPHGLTLSVTIAGWQKLPAAAFDAVDSVNLMAYDHPGRHATFDGAVADAKRLQDLGAPAHKLTLGVPFYGRSIDKSQRTASYAEIVAKHRPRDDVDEVGGLYFNGPATLRKKIAFARSQGLAGAMIWELGQDAAGQKSLLGVLRAAAK